ncbi:hypothetical protein [Dysgonomonas termitidis]|uniref:Lipoprotein n=1 Tax=Dysgonomonas termitidis TaxID=1516126 RepID=A0ABV9KZK7_9BACT
MKNIAFFFTSLILFISCDDNSIPPVSVKLEPFIIENYSADARQLYFNEVFKNPNNPDHNNPELNVDEERKVLEIIQAVYNLQSLERDTVFNIYKIHGYYCYNFNSIYLKVNTALPAIRKLAEGIIPTGDAELDKVLTKYKPESVKPFYGYPEFPWLTITTKKEYNMIPVEAEFRRLKSVLTAEFNNGCVGGGNTIDLERKGNTATIIFSIGEGDCPAGCIYHRYWKFEVTNGMARFMNSYSNY